jgi:hypothetical protein
MLISHSYEDEDFPNFLKELRTGGHLEGAAAGVLAKVIEEGVGRLSEKQLWVFESLVINEFVTEDCVSCSQTIPWCEMYAAYFNGGLCAWCEHKLSNND